MRKAGNRLRISAQLVNVADGYHLWSERFDRTIDDVFLIQDEIARSITESLRVTLTRPGTGMMVKPATSNIDAYHLYLRGRFLLNKFADLYASWTSARKCFEEAIALDPMYSAAYAGLSEVWTALGYTTFVPAPEASRAALEAAERAVTLDPSLPEGHTALGWTKTLFAMDMRTAERDFQRALEIAPGYAPAHGYYALLLCGFGRFDEAIDHATQARHHDPLWMMMPFIMSQVLICARRFAEAERQMREILTIDPNFAGGYWYLSSALMGQGRIDEAIEMQEKGVELVQSRAVLRRAAGHVVLPQGPARRGRGAARGAGRRRPLHAGVAGDAVRRARKERSGVRVSRAGDRAARRSGVVHGGRSPFRQPARRSAIQRRVAAGRAAGLRRNVDVRFFRLKAEATPTLSPPRAAAACRQSAAR